MLYAFYNALLLPVWAGLNLLRPLLGREFRERMGQVDVVQGRHVRWIHCASVGELSAISGLVREIKKREPDSHIVISTVTSTGRTRSAELFPNAVSLIAPIDSPFFVRNALNRVAPDILFIVETELWPNLISLAHRRGIPVVMLNGRLSARSVRRYLRLKPLFSRVLNCVDWFFVQTEADRSAFVKLGAPAGRVSVTGTLKSDLSFVPVDREALLASFGVPPEARVIVAGSVRPEEEEDVLRAFASVAGEISSAYFVIAPRHLERAEKIGRSAREMGMKVRFRSVDHDHVGENLLILDTIGELARVYGAAHVSFVGGSLRPYGGHNVLEPAMWGVPVLFGKFTSNCAEEAEELASQRGGVRIDGWRDLAAEVLLLLRDEKLRAEMGQNARNVVKTRSGVSAAVYEMLRLKGYLRGQEG